MHFLHGIQVAGKNNHVWAAAHLDLIKMLPKNWHIDADNKPDRLQTILPRNRQNTRRLQASPSLVGLFVRPAVDYYQPKMQELHWLSSALRLLRRPAA